MNKPGYTPGPWEATYVSRDPNGKPYEYIVIAGAVDIISRIRAQNEWAESTSHLICAAPEMAEALLKAQTALLAGNHSLGEAGPVLDEIRAALKKAGLL